MCGTPLTEGLPQCEECGEPVGDLSLGPSEQNQTELQKSLDKNLAILVGMLILFGHITWIAAIAMLGILQKPLIGLSAFVVGSAWIATGYASSYKKRWGILIAVIVSYLTLAGCLLYWNLFGIIVSLTLSIQAHRVLRLSHQVSEEDPALEPEV